MAFKDQWTKAQILAKCRQELLDTGTRWWPDVELNHYIDEWEDVLQDTFNFVWGVTTVTTATATLTLSSVIPNFMRLDAVYRNGLRLAARTKGDLDQFIPDWRNVTAGVPTVAYQDDHETVSFWPPPSGTGTFTLEYTQEVAFAAGTSTMTVPAWTKYSAINYVCFRAFMRYGPNFDLNKALRRKAKWQRQLARYRTFYNNRFPQMPLVLRPGGHYEHGVVEPNPTITQAQVV